MTTSREGAPNIEELLRGLGEEAVLREAEAAGLSPKARRMRCPFPGCAHKGKERQRDAQLYAGGHPRLWCYACEGRGDLIDLLQVTRALSRQEAIAYLTGQPVPARPPLQLVPPHPPAEEPEKLAPAEVRRLWDALGAEDEGAQAYLEGRSLGAAVGLGLLRFATDKHSDLLLRGHARRGYRVAALLSDVVGNPRGIQLRRVGEPRGKEPKIISVKGSVTARAFFGDAGGIEASPVVGVAEGLADTMALAGWTSGHPGVTVVGAAGKSFLPRLAQELEAAGIPLEGKLFILFPQNDRPKNHSRREFVRLQQLLVERGARVVLHPLDAEYKDLAEWLHAKPENEWPPPEVQKAFAPEEDGVSIEHRIVLPKGAAVPLPAQVRTDVYAQNFTTLCALLDDPVHRSNIIGPGELSFCEMTHMAQLNGRAIEEVDLSAIRLGIESQGKNTTDGKPLKFKEEEIGRALKMLARRFPIHPVREFLKGLKWDGTRRLDTELPGALGHGEESFACTLLRRWMVSLVARPLDPGCKVDTVLVLMSEEQGARKSTFFEVLGGEWFTDSPVNVGDKDGKLLMRKKWIIEWAELDSMKRARDKEQIRAFLSSRVDDFREPYGRGVISAPRSCVIVGTTNEQQFLQDHERRFWPIRIGRKVDFGWVREHREQLLAEAVAIYQAASECVACAPLLPYDRCGEHSWWLTEEEDQALRETNQDHRMQHPWTELVGDWLLGKDAYGELTSAQVLIEALNKPQHQITNGDEQAVGRVMRELGWSRCRRRLGGGRARWVFVRR